MIDGPARLQDRLARTGYPGRHLEFSASAVEEMPDTLMAALIAHELARALLCSQDDDARRPKDDASRQARGNLVDGLTRTWGFGPDSVREWAVAHGAVPD